MLVVVVPIAWVVFGIPTGWPFSCKLAVALLVGTVFGGIKSGS